MRKSGWTIAGLVTAIVIIALAVRHQLELGVQERVRKDTLLGEHKVKLIDKINDLVAAHQEQSTRELVAGLNQSVTDLDLLQRKYSEACAAEKASSELQAIVEEYAKTASSSCEKSRALMNKIAPPEHALEEVINAIKQDFGRDARRMREVGEVVKKYGEPHTYLRVEVREAALRWAGVPVHKLANDPINERTTAGEAVTDDDRLQEYRKASKWVLENSVPAKLPITKP